jgi:hypothetical protein
MTLVLSLDSLELAVCYQSVDVVADGVRVLV